PSLNHQDLTSIILSSPSRASDRRDSTEQMQRTLQNGETEGNHQSSGGSNSCWTPSAAGKAIRQDIERELFHTKSLLKTAYVELNERDTRAKALEGHLHAARAEVQTLTQQFCNIKEELDTVQKELKHFLETTAAAEGKGSIQTNSEMTHGVTLKDLNRMARNIPAFTPELAGDHDVHAYLRDIDFYLQSWTSANHQDRFYLLWITSSPEVRRFMAQQPGHIQSDYQRLKQAIIKDFSDPESEHGLIAALDTKQGRHETPHTYYRHHLGIMACCTMPIQQLRDLTQKAFNKHKASTKGNPKQAPEVTQHCHNARPFYRKPLTSRGQSRHLGNRPRFQTNHWEKPWKKASSSCKHHGMSNSSPPKHPPPHPSHRCQTDQSLNMD
uniref:Retrotransposon gag domain-containing protein n=1 Tax=Sinocyclocheilus rhinocerous TaxID=307959 RepID=A0A673GI44_9TELE